ncbi:MAG: BREX-6 system phosphatase PglZ [Cyanobacteria bacterium J06627_28]
MPTLGPITEKLESELSSRLRNQSLVIWLDKDSHYTPYVDQLIERRAKGDFFAPVVAFRGSYLEMMLALQDYGNRAAPDILLIHMPGHTEDTIRKTPVLELYRAGHRYRKALDTLLKETAAGKVGPSEVDAYLSRDGISLEGAEQWLAEAIAQPSFTVTPTNTTLALDDLADILDELLSPKRSFKQKFDTEAARSQLTDHLYRNTGLDTAFLSFYLQTKPSAAAYSFANLSEAFCAWLMCVEYVHDLQRDPKEPALKPLKRLSKPLVAECDRLIRHLRDRHPTSYVTIADATESRLSEEFTALRPEDLGKIDTFRIEETTVFEDGALTSLRQRQWPQALSWAEVRLTSSYSTTTPKKNKRKNASRNTKGAQSFWLQRSPERRIEWTLIQSMAHLGTKIEQVGTTPLSKAQTLREALDAYTQIGYRVDLAHRQLEQKRSQLLESTLPHFNALTACANDLRQHYRDWANQWAKSFAALCEAKGFLPEADLQQRMLYDQTVHPLVKSAAKGEAKVAYFLVDALRYEMAAALHGTLQADITDSTTLRLSARYAELPTLTSVGMNALAPVQQNGQLTLHKETDFKGFRAGEYNVSTFENRVRAMGDRSSSVKNQPKLFTLADICEKSTKSFNAQLEKANFAIIRSQEIDKAGESNIGITTFERWLQQLKAAWNRLKNLGYNEFVFTADHGFLLQDDTAVEGIQWGKAPKRRHVLLPNARKESKIVSVSLSALGYQSQSGPAAGYLHFSTTTNPFVKGSAIATFIHGGNSLQERVIPVLTLSHRQNNNLQLVKYSIEAQAQPSIAGYSRLRAKVTPAAQGVLSFTGAKTINLSLRVPNRPDIDLTIAEAPGAVLNNQQVQAEVAGNWVEVLFNMVSLQDERVKVEVYQSDGAEDVTPALVDDYFAAAGTKVNPKADSDETRSPSKTTPKPAQDWQTSLEDESVRQVFVHIQQHNAITEAELIALLGSPRKGRRFSANFETYLSKLPFLVRVESTANGKRYIKEGSKPESPTLESQTPKS